MKNRQLQFLESLDYYWECPISNQIMQDPVVTCDGFTYQRKSIENWLQKSKTSPATNLPLNSYELIPNIVFRNMIEKFKNAPSFIRKSRIENQSLKQKDALEKIIEKDFTIKYLEQKMFEMKKQIDSLKQKAHQLERQIQKKNSTFSQIKADKSRKTQQNDKWYHQQKNQLQTIISPTVYQEIPTHIVTLSIDINGENAGNIIIYMFGKVVPKTVENFITLCQGSKFDNHQRLTFQGSKFHRIIPQFMIQGGDFIKGDGTGGKSIWGNKFKDENFILKHEPFCISMANAGPNTNGSQFFITTSKTSWLDGKHTVFGCVKQGIQVVKSVEAVGSASGKPSKTVTIRQCKSIKINDFK